jgi:hypothetical protein
MARTNRKPPAPDQASTEHTLEQVRAELESVRRLLALLLVKLGSGSKEVALALGVPDSTVRNWMPTRNIAKIVRDEREE